MAEGQDSRPSEMVLDVPGDPSCSGPGRQWLRPEVGVFNLLASSRWARVLDGRFPPPVATRPVSPRAAVSLGPFRPGVGGGVSRNPAVASPGVISPPLPSGFRPLLFPHSLVALSLNSLQLLLRVFPVRTLTRPGAKVGFREDSSPGCGDVRCPAISHVVFLALRV